MRNYLLVFIIILLCSNAVFSQSVGGVTSGTKTFCSSSNSGVITLSGQVGNVLNWELSTNGGSTWINIPNSNPNQTYFNLNQTTCYRAIIQGWNISARYIYYNLY